MKPVALFTSRLHLRRTQKGDAETLFSHYCADKERSRFLTRLPHQTIRQTSQFLTRWCKDAWADDSTKFAWVISLEETNEAIGLFLVNVEDSQAQIHYGIRRAFEGQGLVTEAGKTVIQWLVAQPQLQRIWTVCDIENHGSINVLKNLGFQKEKMLQKHLTLPAFNDELRDCYLFSLTNRTIPLTTLDLKRSYLQS